jgi:hypothetical protein
MFLTFFLNFLLFFPVFSEHWQSKVDRIVAGASKIVDDLDPSNEEEEINNLTYKTYDDAMPKIENQQTNKNDPKANDLNEFYADLDSIAAQFLNKLDNILEFGEDSELIEAINKADEDDMDGLIDEE